MIVDRPDGHGQKYPVVLGWCPRGEWNNRHAVQEIATVRPQAPVRLIRLGVVRTSTFGYLRCRQRWQ